MIDSSVLYEDREITVRRIERLEKEISICRDRKNEWVTAERELKALLDREQESLNTIDEQAVKICGQEGARQRGFYVP